VSASHHSLPAGPTCLFCAHHALEALSAPPGADRRPGSLAFRCPRCARHFSQDSDGKLSYDSSALYEALYAAAWRTPGGISSALDRYRSLEDPASPRARILREDLQRVLADPEVPLPELLSSPGAVTPEAVRTFLQVLWEVIEGRRSDPREELNLRSLQALDQCERALEEHPQDRALLRHKADLLFQLHGGGVAAAGWDLLTGYPGSPVGSKVREQDAGTLAAWDTLLELDPTDWEAWRQRAFYLLRLGRYEEELACWDQLLAHLPDSDLRPLRGSFSIPATQLLVPPGGGAQYYQSQRADCWRRLHGSPQP
jgi:tetratricopeptide (TPR) repeat protein